MVVLKSNSPFSSKHTTLHPVLNPGSIANMRFAPSGAANSNCFRFDVNTRIASLSALIFAWLISSFSKEEDNKRV